MSFSADSGTVPEEFSSPPDDEEGGLSSGQRLAGAILLVNGLLVLYERLMLSGALSFDGALQSPASSIIDIGLGIALLAGQASVLGFVMFRVVAGALLLGGMYLVQGDPLMAGLQVVFSATLVALIYGRAGGARTAIAGTCAISFLGFEVLGIQMLTTGRVASSSLIAAQYDLEELESTSLTSELAPYRIQSPGDGWALRSDAAAKADNPLADFWLVQAEYDAHILVIAESAPRGGAIDLDAVVEAVEANARASVQNFVVSERGHVAATHALGTTLDGSGTVDGVPMHFRYGVFAKGPHAIQVACFARGASFEVISSQCDAALESFEFMSSQQVAAKQSI